MPEIWHVHKSTFASRVCRNPRLFGHRNRWSARAWVTHRRAWIHKTQNVAIPHEHASQACNRLCTIWPQWCILARVRVDHGRDLRTIDATWGSLWRQLALLFETRMLVRILVSAHSLPAVADCGLDGHSVLFALSYEFTLHRSRACLNSLNGRHLGTVSGTMSTTRSVPRSRLSPTTNALPN
eukprot:1825489-Pleurochrysis_carterae.AAC.11